MSEGSLSAGKEQERPMTASTAVPEDSAQGSTGSLVNFLRDANASSGTEAARLYQGSSSSSSVQPQGAYPSASSGSYRPVDKARREREIRLRWYWLNGRQSMPVKADQWVPYDEAVQYQLSESVKSMRIEGQTEGLVLDLGPFTNPPMPYQVWISRGVHVTNENEQELVGRLAIAGFSKDLWSRLTPAMLPPEAREGRVVAGYYQVHSTHIDMVRRLDSYMTDSSSPRFGDLFEEMPRRRVVILMEIERPDFVFKDPDRFRKRKPARPPAPNGGSAADAQDDVPAGEAVFQWWWGDPNEGGPGHWKNYHPHVGQRLEEALTTNREFAECRGAVPIDEVRYMLQRISAELPFDHLGKESREPFLPENVVRVNHTHYDQQTRLTNNCFVQFHRGNPKRRRPVRRVRRGEGAGLAVTSGEPCNICYSDAGEVLTGCKFAHAVCGGCLRTALRVTVGDASQKENLMCGCLTVADTVSFENLAKRADSFLEELLKKPPADGTGAKTEFDMENAQVRRAFGVLEPGIYCQKLKEWFVVIRNKEMEGLYHACSHPGCPMENWILREDFDREYRSRGRCTWVCGRGHRNSVLPSEEEINEINRNVLMHPEYYTDSCGVDDLRLRRYRLCPDCVDAGLLTFAVHAEGCKQWPGSAGQHQHCFCFNCTRPWGGYDLSPQDCCMCNHQRRCGDPGIQQVRRTRNDAGEERLEIGFVDGQAYMEWLNTGSRCPPTVFERGVIAGETRQEQLRMEDRTFLLKEIREGTR